MNEDRLQVDTGSTRRRSLSRAFSELLEKRRLGHGRTRALERVARLGGYPVEALASLPPDAVTLWTGCGNPLAWCPSRARAVLEIGSGAGLDLALAARRVIPGGRLMGIDFNVEMCRAARALLEDVQAENVAVHHADIEDLPLADGSCDLVFSNGTLSLISDKNAAITEVGRVLEPSGALVACEIVLDEELPPWMASSGSLALTGVGLALSSEGWRRVLGESGFGRVEVLQRTQLDEARLVDLVDRGISGIEVAGCSASGAIMDIEAAALLEGSVSVFVMKAGRTE